MAFTKKILDAAVKMAVARKSPNVMLLSHETARSFIQGTMPNLHMLYSAAWASGYTVNGINPPKHV